MYAIIETGGKQYKVREGDTIEVELLADDIGDVVELGEVLMVADGGNVTLGDPTVEGAMVKATVLDEVKGDKVVVFKYKPSSRYRVKTGHRQRYNRLRIDEIALPGLAAEAGRDTAPAVEEEPVAAAPAEPQATAADVAEATAESAVAEDLDVEVEAGDAEPVEAEAGDEADIEAEAAAEGEVEAEVGPEAEDEEEDR